MLGWALAGWIGVAAADDGFSLDAVLVPTFPALPGASEATAARIRDAIVQALLDQHLVIGIDEVPPFPAYSASVYMAACPPGRSVGCALILGQRADVDWVLVGEIGRFDGDHVARLSYVDVRNAELILEADVVFDGADDAEVARGAARALDAVIGGLFTTEDLRAGQDAEAQRAISVEGLSVEELDEALDGMERGDDRHEARKVTAEDLEKYEDSDVETPWDRLGMNRFQYVRYRNSGKSLQEWRAKLRGRQGEIVVGTGVVVGQGPWTQAWEGWYGLDAADLTVVERATSLEQRKGLERTWQAELGVGVMPWLSVTAFGGTRMTDWYWRVQQRVEGDEEPIDDPARKVTPTWFVGGRVDFVPMPTFPARPTFSLGATHWWGRDPGRIIAVPDVLPPLHRDWVAALQLAPGFEVEVGKWLLIWGRFHLDLPVAGRFLQEDASDGPIIDARPRPTRSDDGIGTSGSLGLSVRLRVPGKRGRPGPAGL